MFRRYPFLLLVISLAAVAPAALATSYVMVTDRQLVAGSSAVVEGRVLAAEGGTVDGLPATRYRVEVDRLLAGEDPGRQLEVRVPGGVGADGVGLWLHGMPHLAAGEPVLLFLRQRGDGSFGVSQLMLGVFRQAVEEGRRVWVRDHLAAARELSLPSTVGDRQGLHRPRDAEAFGRWIGEAGRGEAPPVDYFVDGDARLQGRATGEFRLFQSDHPLRWFGFDTGGSVRWRVAAGGQPGYGQAATVAAMQSAMAAWNADDASIVDYRYEAIGSGTGFRGRDGVNTLIFDDADGSIDDPFDCQSGGGVLAIGGPWYDASSRLDPRGLRFQAIVEADVVTNVGIECYLHGQPDPRRALEQLLAHELGHTLGISHSCQGGSECGTAASEALMYPYFHTDGRGASLAGDDRAAIRHLYPGDDGGDGNADVGAECGVDALCLQDGRFRVAVSWRSQHQGGRQGIGHPIPSTDKSGYFWFFNQDNVELVVKVLDGRPVNGNFWVFYGGLSDVEYEVRVTDVVSGERRTYRNEPGEICGNGDTAAFPDLGTAAPAAARHVTVPATVPAAAPATASAGACAPSATTLCLQQGRFEVTVDWRDHRTGNTGDGRVLGGQADGEKTGFFWFFNPENVELVVKMIDGAEVNGSYWVFFGGLSDVEYEVRVRDTVRGDVETYRNPPASICGQSDTAAFAAR